MPNQIAQGTTGTATSLGPPNGGGLAPTLEISTTNRWQITASSTIIATQNAAGTVSPPGWMVATGGVVTVPSGAALNTYYATLRTPIPGTATPDGLYQQYNQYDYQFDVIAGIPACDFDINVSAVTAVTYPQKGVASNISFRVTCTKTVGGVLQYLAKSVSLDINWGDGSSSTHSIATNTIGGPLVGIPHTYTSRGVKTITATASVAECSSTGSGSGSVQVVNNRWTCNSGVCTVQDSETDVGFATQAECEASGCGFPGSGWYCVLSGGTQTATNISDGAAWVAAGRPTPRYANQIDCPCYSGPVFWCENGVVKTGTNPPSGVTVYPTSDATVAAGCTTTTPTFTRYRCNSSGNCEAFQTSNANEGFASCVEANCNTTGPSIYYRYRCNSAGVCERYPTLDPLEGFPTCEAANCGATTDPTDPCAFNSYAISDISSGNTQLTLSLFRATNPGWSLKVYWSLNGIPKPNPAIQNAGDYWNWTVPKLPGAHEFIAELTKEGCETHIQPRTVYVEVAPTIPTDPGGEECPPCPPLPEDFDCSPSVSIQLPAASAALKNFALVRVQVSDPNEETDPCHHNYVRSCNPEQSPNLVLFVNEYEVPDLTWKRNSGTPLNGIWETRVDTRDFSNGATVLKVSMRGVGCCRTYASVGVTLANTLQGQVVYRDTIARSVEGTVIYSASIGVETRAMEENTSRRYWEQWGVRSGTTLDGAYKHEDWPKHQPVLPILGAQWEAQGERFERANYSAQVTFRLPLSRDVRFRRKWTPQFYLATFDLDCESVVKIRQVKPGQHYMWTQGAARLWAYDGDKVSKLGDFGDATKTNYYAPDAVDGALWTSEANGRKIIVITPASVSVPLGEMFAFDPDSGDISLTYSVRGETLAPRFVEVVGEVPIALYVGATTKGYDLRFGTPRLWWSLAAPVTFCTVDEDVLYIATAHKLYSSDGVTAPTLVHEFAADVTAATANFVGLTNGEVWKKGASGWVKVLDRDEPIGGVTSWSAGILGEAQTDTDRGVVGGDGDWLVGERGNGSWYDERELIVPIDLVGATVERVAALGHYSVEVTADSSSEDAETLPQKDERILIGTAESGLFFVYQKSLLSERDGAIPVSHDTVPRLFPFWRRE
ncbi:hypothetical protein EON83_17285 [bacterium]|nr:MAG: hypothetical protein EON83_17285 [bacterium]